MNGQEVNAEGIVQEQQQQIGDVQAKPAVSVNPDGTPIQPPEGQESAPVEEVRLTEDDIRNGIEQEKTNVQKRIDKITAEKYSALDRVKQLEQKIDAMAQKMDAPQQKEYTPQQLDEAIKHGIEDGNYALVTEAIDHKMRQAIDGAVKTYAEPQKQEQDNQAKRNELWGKFVSSLNVTDPDYDFSNPTSAAYKYAHFYLTSPDYKDHYDSFGDYSAIQAANDAIRVISEQKRKKKNEGKLKVAENSLAKERMKNQVGYGNAYVTPDVTDNHTQNIQIVDNNIDANLSEFMVYRKGMKSPSSNLQRA